MLLDPHRPRAADELRGRRIIHLDMDAFYAAVEQRDNPELRGRPVVVGGSAEGRGVVSTASYEARRYGIHSAMPAAQAVRRCPSAVFLPVRMRRYLEVSREILRILFELAERVEPVSVDEAFLDVTENRLGFETAGCGCQLELDFGPPRAEGNGGERVQAPDAG